MVTAWRFPGFDSFRFIAACLVVVCHIEIQKHYLKLPTLLPIETVFEIGKMTVTSFFAMSGFLITHLLIREKQETGSIHKMYFYIRRGLRIWPLYFLITGIAFGVLPHLSCGYVPLQSEDLQQHFTTKLLLYLTFLPQFIYLNHLPVPGAEQLWTIGTEEIFYLLWPILLSVFKLPVRVVCYVLGLYLLLKFAAYQSSAYYLNEAFNWPYYCFKILYYNKIECLMMGSLAAAWYHQHPERFRAITAHAAFPILTIGALLGLFACSQWYAPIDYLGYAAIFTLLLSYIGTQWTYPSERIRQADRFLGQITFSLYLWHFLVVMVVLHYGYQPENGWKGEVFLYVLVLVVSILLAILSYFGIEKFFLNKQQAFRKIS